MSEWVKCSERMPENGVLVIGSGSGLFKGCRWVEPVIYDGGEFHPVTASDHSDELVAELDSEMIGTDYWMPLPEPPKD